MRLTRKNFDIVQGDDWLIRLRLYQDKSNVIDLTGSVIKMYIDSNGINTVKTATYFGDPTDGTFDLALTKDETNAFTTVPDFPEYKIKRVFVGREETFMLGQINLIIG